MKKVLKWIGIIVGVLIVLLVVLVGGLYFTGRSRLAQAPQVQGQTVNIPTDENALARGEHLANYVSPCNWTFDNQLQKKRVKFDKKKELQQK
jgi:uncharacterized protein YxeA